MLLAVSGGLHAAVVALFLIASSLGLLKANDIEALLDDDKEPPRLVFLLQPGPGAAEVAGVTRSHCRSARQGQRRNPRGSARRAAAPRPYRPPPRPVIRETPPPPPIPVQPVPVPPSPVQPKPLPVVVAPVVTMAADLEDQAVCSNAPPAPPSASQGPGTGGGAGSGQGTGLGEGDDQGIGPGSGGGTAAGRSVPAAASRLQLQREVKPVYTDEGRRRAIEGDVVMEIVVRRDGSVGDVTIDDRLAPVSISGRLPPSNSGGSRRPAVRHAGGYSGGSRWDSRCAKESTMDTMMWVIPSALALAVGMAVVAWRLLRSDRERTSARGHAAAGLRTRTGAQRAHSRRRSKCHSSRRSAPRLIGRLLQLDA